MSVNKEYSEPCYSPHAHTLLNIRWRDTLSETHDELGNLLDVDNIFILLVGTFLTLSSTSRVDGASGRSCIRIDRNDFGTARDLQRVLFPHPLPVHWKIPQVGRREPSVGLLNAYTSRA